MNKNIWPLLGLAALTGFVLYKKQANAKPAAIRQSGPAIAPSVLNIPSVQKASVSNSPSTIFNPIPLELPKYTGPTETAAQAVDTTPVNFAPDISIAPALVPDVFSSQQIPR